MEEKREVTEGVFVPSEPAGGDTIDDFEKRFNYHAPVDGRAERHEAVRNACKACAYNIHTQIPVNSREKSLVLTKLEEAMYWANAAIARGS